MFRFACMLSMIAMTAGISHGADRVTAIFAMDADGGNVRELASIPGFPIINSPEISPDGKWVAVDGWKAGESLRDARILIVNIESGEVRDLGKGAMPSWSPDGHWFAYCKYAPERGVYVRSLDGETERLIDPAGWGIQWAPDVSKLAYTRGGKFVIHDLIGETQKEVSLSSEWPYRSIYWNSKWSSDANRICFLGTRRDGRREIAILDLTCDEPGLRVRADATDFNPDIAWHPDGSRITLPMKSERNQPGQIYVLDPDRFEPPNPLDGQPTDRSNSGMCFTPDGETLIFLSRR